MTSPWTMSLKFGVFLCLVVFLQSFNLFDREFLDL